LSATQITTLAPVTDFFGIGPEIWGKDDPAAELVRLVAAMSAN
jgi:thiamine-phosphate pyrophosphorylase